MGGGAHDLVVEQASQPPHALGEEGGELASTRSACLRPHLTQLGGFRIESYKEGSLVQFQHHPPSNLFAGKYGVTAPTLRREPILSSPSSQPCSACGRRPP